MLCVAVGPGGGLLKICMLIFQALPKCMHISLFGRAYVMYTYMKSSHVRCNLTSPPKKTKNKTKQKTNKIIMDRQ